MKVTKTGNKLVLTIDLLDVDNAPTSKSGRSKVLFTTNGFNYESGVGVGISINIIAAKR